MNGFTVIECDDAQVTLKFCDPYPVPNASIIGLNFLADTYRSARDLLSCDEFFTMSL